MARDELRAIQRRQVARGTRIPHPDVRQPMTGRAFPERDVRSELRRLACADDRLRAGRDRGLRRCRWRWRVSGRRLANSGADGVGEGDGDDDEATATIDLCGVVGLAPAGGEGVAAHPTTTRDVTTQSTARDGSPGRIARPPHADRPTTPRWRRRWDAADAPRVISLNPDRHVASRQPPVVTSTGLGREALAAGRTPGGSGGHFDEQRRLPLHCAARPGAAAASKSGHELEQR